MKLTKQSFRKQLLAVALVYPILMLAACNFSTGLQEAGKIIATITPFINLVPAFVCPVEAALCGPVTIADQVAVTAATDVSNFFDQWSVASAAAQPGILNQLLAGVATLKTDQAALIAAAQVKNTAAATQINGIATSIEGAITDLATLLQQAQAGGGTTAALAAVLEDADPSYEGPVIATWVANPLNVFKSPNTLKLKSGAKVHTVHYRKAQILATLSVKTGDPAVDAVSAAKLKALK